MAKISYIDATCIYEGAAAPSVADLSLDVEDGEFMVLVGPSGSGKSTALRMLAGLGEVSSGEIHIDEPLSNLDAKLRVETRANIASLQARLGTTTIYVTHDQVEAMTMGHRVAVLKDARLQQVDTPRRLYERPAHVFVAEFIGSPAMNLRTAALNGEGARLGGALLPIPRDPLAAARADGQDEVVIGLRPESADLAAPGSPNAVDLTVRLVEELGADAYVYGELAGDAPGDKAWVVRCDGRSVPHIGDHVGVVAHNADAHLFNARSGLRLNA